MNIQLIINRGPFLIDLKRKIITVDETLICHHPKNNQKVNIINETFSYPKLPIESSIDIEKTGLETLNSKIFLFI